MKTKATLQMVAIAKRIAAKNGVSVDEVLDRFDQDVKKTSFVKRDMFLGDSVITLHPKKRCSNQGEAKVCRRLRRNVAVNKGVGGREGGEE